MNDIHECQIQRFGTSLKIKLPRRNMPARINVRRTSTRSNTKLARNNFQNRIAVHKTRNSSPQKKNVNESTKRAKTLVGNENMKADRKHKTNKRKPRHHLEYLSVESRHDNIKTKASHAKDLNPVDVVFYKRQSKNQKNIIRKDKTKTYQTPVDVVFDKRQSINQKNKICIDKTKTAETPVDVVFDKRQSKTQKNEIRKDKTKTHQTPVDVVFDKRQSKNQKNKIRKDKTKTDQTPVDVVFDKRQSKNQKNKILTDKTKAQIWSWFAFHPRTPPAMRPVASSALLDHNPNKTSQTDFKDIGLIIDQHKRKYQRKQTLKDYELQYFMKEQMKRLEYAERLKNLRDTGVFLSEDCEKEGLTMCCKETQHKTRSRENIWDLVKHIIDSVKGGDIEVFTKSVVESGPCFNKYVMKDEIIDTHCQPCIKTNMQKLEESVNKAIKVSERKCYPRLKPMPCLLEANLCDVMNKFCAPLTCRACHFIK